MPWRRRVRPRRSRHLMCRRAMHLGALHPRRSLVPICLGHNHNRHSRLSHQQQHLPTSMRSNSSHSSSRAAATTTIPRHLIYSNDICDAKGLSSTTQTHAHIRNRDDVLMMFIDYYLLLNWLLNQPQLFRLPPPPPDFPFYIYFVLFSDSMFSYNSNPRRDSTSVLLSERSWEVRRKCNKIN